MSGSRFAWITCLRPQAQARLRLFCFPYAGGGASVFYPWARLLEHLPIELCGVQLPGRENRLREAPFTSVPEVIEALTADLAPYTARPFVFFGHSMGAVLSFELARRLRRKGGPLPRALFLSGAEPPQRPRRFEPLSGKPDAEFLQALERYRGVPAGLWENAELRELMLPVLKADFQLIESYTYQPEDPLECTLTALGGREDPLVTPDSLAGWQVHTRRDFSLKLFPGDHFYLNPSRLDLVGTIARQLGLGPAAN